MRLIAKLFNMLFGNKNAEREAAEREKQLRFEHEQEIKRMQLQHAHDLMIMQARQREREAAAKKLADKTKEDELLKRLSTYNKPVVITKTVTVTPCAEAITDKQEKFITAIEAVINKHYGYRKVQFRGATKREAMSWISANVKEFETIKELNKMKRAAR